MKQELTNQKQEIKSLLESEKFQEEIAKAMPKFCDPVRFLRIATTAFNQQPKLYGCTKMSLFQCMLDLSSVGLEPDGRHAYLIPFKDQCTLQIGYKGLLAMLRRNGVSMDAKLVHENDSFLVEEDDGQGNTKVSHSVAYGKPRGEMICVYTRATWVESGTNFLSYEFMTREEIDYIRSLSQAKNGTAWQNHYGEMARKTVIKRHAKRLPLSSEVEHVINSEHDNPDFSKSIKKDETLFETKPAEVTEQDA